MKKFLKIIMYSFIIIFSLIALFITYLYVDSIPDKHWIEFRAIGIQEYDKEINDLIFLTENIGYAVGSQYMHLKNNKYTAVVYKTENGGKNWILNMLGKGKIEKIYEVQDSIILLKEENTNKKYKKIWSKDITSSFWTFTQTTLYENKDSKKWYIIYKANFPFYIRLIKFYSPKNGYAIFENQITDQNYIFKTVNKGRNWKKIGIIDKICQFTELEYFNGELFFISSSDYFKNDPNKTNNQSGYNDVLASYNLKEKRIKKWPIPDRFTISKITLDNKKNLWIAGDINRSLNFIKINLKSEMDIIKPKCFEEDYSIDSFHVFDRRISMTTYSSCSIFGCTHKFYLSEDLGKSWEEEMPPSTLILKPIFFMRNEFIWGYCGSNFISKRTDLK